ncbi:MAG: hypothetical protein EF811_01985 [Methanonatronarchaeia archaeon]|nr:MAG: hypothetical protein EF811_01985 [Methanonatronarchaeia archaeon]
MTLPNGVWGKIARVDVSDETTEVIEPDEEVYQKFYGGESLGMYFLFEEGIVDPDIEPFDPENMVQVMLGPTNGLAAAGRSCTVTKSPYNFAAVSRGGGQTPRELKWAGWDGVQVVGQADDPVYISIVNDEVEVRDASDIAGKNSRAKEMWFKRNVFGPHEKKDDKTLGEAHMTDEWADLRPLDDDFTLGEKRNAKAWSIGVGGENQVWYAALGCDGNSWHGRHGEGAVLGSKNVMGIAVRGTKGVKYHDKQAFLQWTRESQEAQRASTGWRFYGTTNSAGNALDVGCWPMRNWQWVYLNDPDAVRPLDGMYLTKATSVKGKACSGCAQQCYYTSRQQSDKYTESPGEIDDYTLDGAIGIMPCWEMQGCSGGVHGYFFPQGPKDADYFEGLDPSDTYPGNRKDMLEAAMKMQYTDELENKYGLDTIEGGNNIALVQELWNKDLITTEDLDGIEPYWGDVDAVQQLLEKIAHKDGELGEALAKGTWETAKYFARKKGELGEDQDPQFDAEEIWPEEPHVPSDDEIMYYAMACKRYGMPAHGVRSERCRNALAYLVQYRPHVHTGGNDSIGANHYISFVGSAVFCLFSPGPDAELINAATGWGHDDEDTMLVGERAWNLGRLFNIHTQEIENPREEWDAAHMMPQRWFDEPLTTGPPEVHGKTAHRGNQQVTEEGSYENLWADLEDYWDDRGWTTDKGIPTAAKLEELDIDDLTEDIAAQYR